MRCYPPLTEECPAAAHKSSDEDQRPNRIVGGFDAIFQIFDFARSLISRDDNLFILVNKGVESMKEFFLSAIFSGDKLNIIYHQNVKRTKQLFEIHHLAIRNACTNLYINCSAER